MTDDLYRHPDEPRQAATVTILRARQGCLATKRYTSAGVESYRVSQTVAAYGRTVFDLGGLFGLLTRLSCDPRAFIVRGVPHPEADHDNMNRRYLDDPRKPEPPHMVPADCGWLCVDVDSLDVGDQGQAMSPRERVFEVLAHLPALAMRAGCVVQWSSSAGCDGWRRLKAHVWFLLDRPAYCKSWKSWWAQQMEAGRSGAVDLALYQPVQPHYTASPLFCGVPDPVAGERLIYVPGPRLVVPETVVGLDAWLVEQDEIARQRRIAQEQARLRVKAAMAVRSERAVHGTRRSYARAALSAAVEAIGQCPEGMRHDTVRDQAIATYGLVLSGALAHDQWWASIEQAALARLGGEGREREVLRLMESATTRAVARDLSTVGGRP